LSARLCASLKTYGERNLFLLETRLGSLKGTKPDAIVAVEMRKAVPERAADLSKTAGAEGPQGLTLNPERGQHRRGSDPNLRDRVVAPLWFEPRRPDCGRNAASGGRLSDVVLPRFAMREL
jgi:hypothetical protein